jgi:flagellar hook protein FlgE
MTSFEFDNAGHVIGSFEDTTHRRVYKVPLAFFTNPNGLEMQNGQVFLETPGSGTPTTYAIDDSQLASLSPYAIELSNVDITTEFSRMIMLQSAYNSSATVFRTLDEMTTTARDLKA